MPANNLQRAVRLGLLAGVFISLASCRLTGGPSDTEIPALDQARSELRSCIEDVTRATASRYGVEDNWRTWRVFLYDDISAGAEQLDIRTHAGSVAFSNPTIAQIEIGRQTAILVTLFIPQEGAAGAEAGELIYYRACEIES
ncbi:MAG: hypothetical protein A2Z16_06990 [Chloroflexi bacterium RBG_16_54_18]|nr:MAG: hypothetical protein A2Z16_06990 [Chloroflexi bacterium RBG_16_54_18]